MLVVVRKPSLRLELVRVFEESSTPRECEVGVLHNSPFLDVMSIYHGTGRDTGQPVGTDDCDAKCLHQTSIQESEMGHCFGVNLVTASELPNLLDKVLVVDWILE